MTIENKYHKLWTQYSNTILKIKNNRQFLDQCKCDLQTQILKTDATLLKTPVPKLPEIMEKANILESKNSRLITDFSPIGDACLQSENKSRNQKEESKIFQNFKDEEIKVELSKIKKNEVGM